MWMKRSSRDLWNKKCSLSPYSSANLNDLSQKMPYIREISKIHQISGREIFVQRITYPEALIRLVASDALETSCKHTTHHTHIHTHIHFERPLELEFLDGRERRHLSTSHSCRIIDTYVGAAIPAAEDRCSRNVMACGEQWTNAWKSLAFCYHKNFRWHRS